MLFEFNQVLEGAGKWWMSVPPVVWSGLVGALIAVIGVILSNWSHTSRLKSQLKHDREENDRERINGLRRDVYLVAAEEVIKAMNLLPRLHEEEFSKDPTKGFTAFFAAMGKLHVVANYEAVPHVIAFNGVFGRSLMVSIKACIPIQKLRVDINVVSESYDRQMSLINQFMEERQRMLLVMDPDRERFDFLGKMVESYRVYANELSDERVDIYKKLQEELRGFSVLMAGEIVVLAEMQINLLAAIRKDLGFDSNLDLYRGQLKEQNQEGMGIFDEVLQKVDSDLMGDVAKSS